MPTNNKRIIYFSNQAIYGVRPLEDGHFYIMYRDNAKVQKKFYKKGTLQAFDSPQQAQYALDRMIADFQKSNTMHFKARELGMWDAVPEFVTDEN